MSRKTILDDLVSQLDGLTNIKKATMRLLLFADQENHMPYVGVIPGDDLPQVSDGYDTRYNMNVTLIVKTKEDEVGLESLIEDIKTLMQSIDLGEDVLSARLVGTQEVDIKDFELASRNSRYSATGMVLEIIFTENFGTPYPAIESRTLTEPDGFGHYKIYETLASGSTTIQPLGTNIYDSHSRAALLIPPGSGSISIGSIDNVMDEEDGAIYDDERIENHLMAYELRIHSSFISEFAVIPNPFAERLMVDNITPLLWGRLNSVLGDGYRVHEIINVFYGQDFPTTLGATMTVVIEKVIPYT